MCKSHNSVDTNRRQQFCSRQRFGLMGKRGIYKVGLVFLYFIFISFKERKQKGMNKVNSVNYGVESTYFGGYSMGDGNFSIVNLMSKALSISIQQYSKAKIEKMEVKQTGSPIQIHDSSIQNENNFSEGEIFSNNENLNLKHSQQIKIKKLSPLSSTSEKSHSHTTPSEPSRKNSLKKSFLSSHLIQIEDGDVLEATCPPKIMSKQQIEEKREGLLGRKVELESRQSKKVKYHGIGPQKRQLKMLS